MTNSFSPAAQAVLAAYRNRWDFDLAAALEALADQVVPREAMDRNHVSSLYQQRMDTRAHILAIAAELRGDSLTIQGD